MSIVSPPPQFWFCRKVWCVDDLGCFDPVAEEIMRPERRTVRPH
jgi:hypothetical protein